MRAPGGRKLLTMRHLGSMYSPTSSFVAEREQRRLACAKGWSTLKGFWQSKSPFRVKRLFFQLSVISPLLSGLEGFLLSKQEYRRLALQLTKKLRYLLKGNACQWDGSSHPKSLSTAQLFRKWKLVPTAVELVTRRLGMWQSIARQPTVFGHFLTIVFGRLRCEEEAEQSGRRTLPPPLDEDGSLNVHGHSFAKQLWDDLDYLLSSRAGEELDEVWDKSLIGLLTPGSEANGTFIDIDLQLLRSEYLSHSVPPTNWVEALPAESPEAPQQEEDVFECDLADSARQVCGRVFTTKKGLLAHQLHSEGGEHGIRCVLSQVTLANECIACRTRFSSRAAEQHHLHRSWLRGKCIADMPAFEYSLTPPSSLVCPMYDAEAGHHDEETQQPYPSYESLREHLASHFPHSPLGPLVLSLPDAKLGGFTNPRLERLRERIRNKVSSSSPGHSRGISRHRGGRRGRGRGRSPQRSQSQ